MAGGADNVTGTDAVGLVLRRPRVRRLRQTLAAGLREAVAAADLPAAGRAEAERHVARRHRPRQCDAIVENGLSPIRHGRQVLDDRAVAGGDLGQRLGLLAGVVLERAVDAPHDGIRHGAGRRETLP